MIYHTNIEDTTKANSFFRQVLFTASHMQLVVMSLLPGEEIGMEIHHENDQFFRFEEGQGKVITDDGEQEVREDDVVIIPAGTNHNIINTGTIALKLYTIYGPAHHADKTVHKTKAEAVAAEEH